MSLERGEVTGLILAGGAGRRMVDRDKGLVANLNSPADLVAGRQRPCQWPSVDAE